MKFKELLMKNAKKIVGSALLLSLVAVQSVGAATSVSDSVISRGNIEYDADGDGSADVYFYSKDLKTIAGGIDSIDSNIAALKTEMATLASTTAAYKSDIVSGLNKTVYTKSNIESSASFSEIISKINSIPVPDTLTASYYAGGNNSGIGGLSSSSSTKSVSLGTNTTFNLAANEALTLPAGFYANDLTIQNNVKNLGNVTKSLGAEQSYTIEPGYYTGGTITNSDVNRGSLSQTLNPGGSYTLAAGYYSGGTVKANANTQTYTYPANSTGATVDLGASNLYRYVNAANVYNKGKADGKASITGGNATAAKILSGSTAYVNAVLVTGTMANYSSSTAQACTTANTGNKLYVKPVNAGYYTNASSFNTGIAYNPNKTISASTSTNTATGVGTTNAATINLDKDQKVTMPAGYYPAQTIQNVASGGSLERLTHSVTFYHIAYEWTQNETYSCPGWIDYHDNGTISCNYCGYDYTAERGRTGGCGRQITGPVTHRENYWTMDSQDHPNNVIGTWTPTF